MLRGRGFSSRCSIKTKFKNGRRLTWFRSYPFPHGFLRLWAKKGASTETDAKPAIQWQNASNPVAKSVSAVEVMPTYLQKRFCPSASCLAAAAY